MQFLYVIVTEEYDLWPFNTANSKIWIQTFKTKLSAQVNSLPADKLQEIQKAIELFSVGQGPAKTMEEATRRSYQFWDTQPVPKLGMMSAVLSLLLQTVKKYKQIPAVFVFHEWGFVFFQGRRWHRTAALNPTKTAYVRSLTASRRASAGTLWTWGAPLW